MSVIVEDKEWQNFIEIYDKFIFLVNDFKELEVKFRHSLKKTNLEHFESSVENGIKMENLTKSIISSLNKQLLTIIMYENKFHVYSYELLHSMATIFTDVHSMLKHPDLNVDCLNKYYTNMSKITDLQAQIEAKYIHFLTSYTNQNSNKKEIVYALAAEVQLLKLLLEDKIT